MVLTMMPIHLAQTLIPPHPSNRVLHLDPPPRKRPIEGFILWRPLFAAWFAARRSAQSLRVQLGDPDVSQITYS